MFDYLVVLISVISFFIALFIVPVLFIIRLYLVVRDGLETKKALFVLLMPLSYGYFQTYNEKTINRKIYISLIIIQFVLMLIGLVLIIYTRYM